MRNIFHVHCLYFQAFTRYGRILNCTCVSSGNGVEYVYIEFDSINSVRSMFSSERNHFVGRTSLAVKQPLRPSQAGIKIEPLIDTPKPNPAEFLR